MATLMAELQLERADEADLEAVAALMNAAYRRQGGAAWNTESGYIAGQRTDAALLAAGLADDARSQLLLWRQDGELIGCVQVTPWRGDIWALGSLAIRPDRQGGGLGAAMLRAGEDAIRSAGGRVARISVVHVRDALIAWYERRGYVATGESEAFPYGDHRFGVPLRDDLCFTVLEKRLDRQGGVTTRGRSAFAR